jgi:hypothetical protein
VNRLLVDPRRTDRLDDDIELIRATLSTGRCGFVLSQRQRDRLKDLRDRSRSLTDRQYDLVLDAWIKVHERRPDGIRRNLRERVKRMGERLPCHTRRNDTKPKHPAA